VDHKREPVSTLLERSTTRRDFLQKTGAGAAAAAVALTGARHNAVRAQEKVELEYWWPVSPGEAGYDDEMAVLDAFQKANPTIKINVQTVPWEQLANKITIAAQGGNLPDLAWSLAEQLSTYLHMGIVPDMTEEWNGWSDKSAIYPQALAQITSGQKMYGAMPHYLGIRAFLYHTDLFKKAGIETPPKTWDELIQTGQTLKDAGIPAFGFCGQSVRQPQEVIVYFWQNDLDIAVPTSGGKFRNTWKDKPDELARATEVFQFYDDLVHKYGIVPQEVSGWGYTELDTNFAQASIASAVDGPWMESYEKDNPDTMKDVAVAAIPYKKTPATFLEVNYQVTFKNAKHPKEAWEFLKFIGGKTAQSMAAYKDRSVRQDVKPTPGKWTEGFLALVPQGKVWPPVSLEQITQHMIDAFQSVLLQQAKPDEAAAKLSDQVNSDLAETGEG
jgi:ABC-type glycerol-3-phosphate transport system substrate-binding protein